MAASSSSDFHLPPLIHSSESTRSSRQVHFKGEFSHDYQKTEEQLALRIEALKEAPYPLEAQGFFRLLQKINALYEENKAFLNLVLPHIEDTEGLLRQERARIKKFKKRVNQEIREKAYSHRNLKEDDLAFVKNEVQASREHKCILKGLLEMERRVAAFISKDLLKQELDCMDSLVTVFEQKKNALLRPSSESSSTSSREALPRQASLSPSQIFDERFAALQATVEREGEILATEKAQYNKCTCRHMKIFNTVWQAFKELENALEAHEETLHSIDIPLIDLKQNHFVSSKPQTKRPDHLTLEIEELIYRYLHTKSMKETANKNLRAASFSYDKTEAFQEFFQSIQVRSLEIRDDFSFLNSLTNTSLPRIPDSPAATAPRSSLGSSMSQGFRARRFSGESSSPVRESASVREDSPVMEGSAVREVGGSRSILPLLIQDMRRKKEEEANSREFTNNLRRRVYTFGAAVSTVRNRLKTQQETTSTDSRK